jgi:hypothetical protein
VRRSAFAALLLLSLAPPAWASEAQIAYVERRGLLETDAQCHVLEPNVRLAMQASLVQSRGALLRSGWTAGRIGELEAATVSSARQRPCNDPRTAEAATRAHAGFQAWVRAPSMIFQGAARSWTARRSVDQSGWRLRQDTPAPNAATFGVRETAGVQHLTLDLPLARGAPPATAQLVFRDPARADLRFLDVPGRRVRGLEAGLPSPQSVQRFWASGRTIETGQDGARRIVFEFPDAAFEAMSGLDPRETVEARLGADASSPRVLIEIGDLMAARAFLALAPN